MRKIISVVSALLLAVLSVFVSSASSAISPSVDIAIVSSSGSLALISNTTAPRDLYASASSVSWIGLNISSRSLETVPEGSIVYVSFGFAGFTSINYSLATTVDGGTYYGSAETSKIAWTTLNHSTGQLSASVEVPASVGFNMHFRFDLPSAFSGTVGFFVGEVYYTTPDGQIVDLLNSQMDQSQLQHEETKGLLGNIIDGIASLPSKLLDGIKSLFIPSDDYFSNLIEQEQSLCSDHLGVLYQAWEAFSGVSDALSSDSVDTGLSGTGLDTSFVDYAANNPGSFKFPGLSFTIQGETYTLWSDQIVSMPEYLVQWNLSWIPTLTKLLSGFAILIGFVAWCLNFLYDQFGWQACLTGYNMITTFGGLFQKGDGEE